MQPTALSIIATIGLVLAGPSSADPEIADEALRQQVDRLSAATLVDGEGWEVYEQILHPDYTRWAMGTAYEDREEFLANLEEWWDYGMRVASREVEMVGVDIVDDLVIVRFQTTEAFVGPDGPAEGFSGYVTNVWIEEEGEWRLLSAEISSTGLSE